MPFLIDTNSCIDFIVLDILDLFELDNYNFYVSKNVYDELKKKRPRDICKTSCYSDYCTLPSLRTKLDNFLNKIHIKEKYRKLSREENRYLRTKIINNPLYKKCSGKGDLDIICLFEKKEYLKVISRDMDLLKILLDLNKISWYWPPCILMELEEKNLIEVPLKKYNILKGCLNLLDFDKFKIKYKNEPYFIKRAERFFDYLDKNKLNVHIFDF